MTRDQLQHFQSQLLSWFEKNKRDLPWRKNPNWYKTYLSEVILQQTTIDQGLPYFRKFLQAFPDIEKLALADEQHVLHLWSGLGYYSRARNLLKAARILVKEHNAVFPASYKKALQIPGIGPYSAAAILSIAFNKPHAAIDGNIMRVISRLFAIKGDIRQAKTLAAISKKAEKVLDKNRPGAFNEALMELGATVCMPKDPQCTVCPLHTFCHAFKTNRTTQFPYKSPSKAKGKKYHIVCILFNDSRIIIARKPQRGLLAGMWELPVIEVPQNIFTNGYHEILQRKEILPLAESNIFKHTYSHIDLKYKAIIANVKARQNGFDHYVDHKWIDLQEAQNYAIHNAHKKVFEWYNKLIKNQIPGKDKY